MIDTQDGDLASTILLVGSNPTIGKYLSKFGDVLSMNYTDDLPSDGFLSQLRGVVFGGGPDIDIGLYSEEEGEHRLTTNTMPARTTCEVDVFDAATRFNLPMLGICRGAQFLCAMSGGLLVQHVTGHTVSHSILVRDLQSGEWLTDTIVASSTHHQMMMPFILPEDEYAILAKADTRKSDRYERGPNAEKDYQNSDMKCEPEIVMFGKTNALAIQGHPEYTGMGSKEFIEYCDTCIRTHFSIR